MPKKEAVQKKTQYLKKKIYDYKNKVVGLILLLAGLFLLIGFPAIDKINKSDSIKISPELISKQKSDNMPIRVIIPSANIDNLVVEAEIVNGYWETSENSASYGQGSGIPGEKGNIVIFAHAREGLFYNLKNVKNNEIIYVLTKDKWYKYKVNKIIQVYPNEKEVILPTKTETLTLYTCTGFNDEKRLVVTALPSN